VGLDFDGTLSAIAPTPDEAVVLPAARAALEALAASVAVCMLSGRDPGDVRSRVGVDAIVAYAGSHGVEVIDHSGRPLTEPSTDLLPMLDDVEARLEATFAGEPGVIVERKRFGVAVHHRLAPDAASRVVATVASLVDASPGMHLQIGKAVAEIRPDAGDKGSAIAWLVDHLGPFTGVLYAGDDTTDEDAFAAIAGHGVGILVAAEDRPTGASFRVASPDRLADLLAGLADAYRRV